MLTMFLGKQTRARLKAFAEMAMRGGGGRGEEQEKEFYF